MGGLPLLSSLGRGSLRVCPPTSTHWSPHSSLHGLGGEPRGPGCSSVFPLCHFCPSLRHFLTKFPELLASPHVPDQDQRDPLFSALAQPRPVTLAPEPRPQLPWGLSPQPPQLRLTGSSLTGWGVVFPSSMGDKVWGEAAGQAFLASTDHYTVCLGCLVINSSHYPQSTSADEETQTQKSRSLPRFTLQGSSRGTTGIGAA